MSDQWATSPIFEGSSAVRAIDFVSPPVITTRRIRPVTFERFYRKKYGQPLWKGIFFLLREGFWTTLAKFRSKRLERRIEASQEIVIALCGGTQRWVGFTRSLGGAALQFHPALLFELSGKQSLDNVHVSPRTVELLEGYLPVQSCPLPIELVAAIEEDNPFLRSARAETLPELRGSQAPEGVSRIGARTSTVDRGGVYLLGLGSYVREYVLPHFQRNVVAAADYKAALIREYAEPLFPVFEESEVLYDLIARDRNPLVIICTYHSDHASMARAVLEANPHARIFIEKPAAVELADIEALANAIRRGAWIDVGFNRRYAPLASAVKEQLSVVPRPLILTFLVKEVKIPPTHWYFWPNQGTRITGNVCHWIDLSYYFVSQRPVACNLQSTGDSVSLSTRFEDGSLSTIVASDYGDDTRGVQELMDVRGGDTTITLTDFRSLTVSSPGRRWRRGRFRRDKGHARMYRDLKKRWLQDGQPRYSPEDLYWVGYVTATYTDMLRSGSRVSSIPG